MSGRNKKVKVVVRFRPTPNFSNDVIAIQQDNKTIDIHAPRDVKRGVVNNQILDWSFKLDDVLHNASQEVVYEKVVKDMVTDTIKGYNGTLMCYGQTGAGKTFTITGATENFQYRGMVPRALAQLYKEVEELSDQSVSIRISYLEIYNETMFDLLSTLPEAVAVSQVTPIAVVEDENGCYVKGLSCHLANTEEEALNLLFEGETNRAIAAHTLNKVSSRSHCIFTIYVESRSRVSSDARYTLSKINFVDLAGSERLGKTQSAGKTKVEAMYINKSLSFLEQVVMALADKRREHVPFRQSKLTHCLKDSIGGICNTRLIANVWGENRHLEETISTLRFATRMMNVHSEPKLNEQYDPHLMVRALEREVAFLKRELAMHDTLTNRTQISYDSLSQQQKYDLQQQVAMYVEGQLDDIEIVNIRQIQGVFEAFRDSHRQLEKNMEAKLRAKFTLVDKTDPASIAAARQAGLPITETGELVGDPDGLSFGVGTLPASAKAGSSSVIANKKREMRRGKSKDRSSPAPKASSPAQSNKGAAAAVVEAPVSQTPTGGGGAEEKREDTDTPSSSVAAAAAKPRPSTPPPRTEAFEEFKRESGQEINRILVENKDILGAKKKAYADLARQINCTKGQLDGSVSKLEQITAARLSQGSMTNEDGDVIITEEEYLEIRRLKDLKAAYKTDYTQLRQLKSEVQYCQHLVDQCRQRLIQEFDNWYAESFLSSPDEQVTEPGQGSRPGATKAEPTVEDEQERFDSLQMELLFENPDSAPFHNAKMRTQRRHQQKFGYRPHIPQRVVKNPPPGVLEVNY